MDYYSGYFEVIQKPESIMRILEASMFDKFPFIAGIVTKNCVWNEHLYKCLIIEGAKVMYRSTDDCNNVVVGLTNSDSRYTRRIGSIDAKAIECILMLPEHNKLVFEKT